MKKCRQCSKPATLHITELRQGDVVEIHLCEGCARDYLSQGDSTPSEPSEFEFAKESDKDESVDEIDDRSCPNCGITFREFRSSGRLGCPHDYVEFEAELVPLLENIHGETQHCGKLPQRAPDTSRRQHELVRLRSELKSAIDEENYEIAAELRDQIQVIESELHGASSGESDE